MTFFLEAKWGEETSLHAAAAESSCVHYWSNKLCESAIQLYGNFTYLVWGFLFN